jgi:hypothetical protein
MKTKFAILLALFAVLASGCSSYFIAPSGLVLPPAQLVQQPTPTVVLAVKTGSPCGEKFDYCGQLADSGAFAFAVRRECQVSKIPQANCVWNSGLLVESVLWIHKGQKIALNHQSIDWFTSFPSKINLPPMWSEDTFFAGKWDSVKADASIVIEGYHSAVNNSATLDFDGLKVIRGGETICYLRLSGGGKWNKSPCKQ